MPVAFPDTEQCVAFALTFAWAMQVELGSLELRARYLGDEQAIVFEVPETSSLENKVMVTVN